MSGLVEMFRNRENWRVSRNGSKVEYSGLVDKMLMEVEGKSPWWFRRSQKDLFDVTVERMVRQHRGNPLGAVGYYVGVLDGITPSDT